MVDEDQHFLGGNFVTPQRPRTSNEAKNRRRSVADEALYTQQYIQRNIEQLTTLWDEVYMSEENRVARLSTAYDHIRTLVDDMVTAETEMVESVKEGINVGQEEIGRLRRDLEKDEWHSHHPFPSISLLRAVEKQQKELQAIYDGRMQEQKLLLSRTEVLNRRLGRTSDDLLPESGELMKMAQFENFKRESTQVEEDLAKRLEEARKWQGDVRRWCTNMETTVPDDPMLNKLLQESVDSDDFVLDNSAMNKMEETWNELSSMYATWVETIDMEWTVHYQTLEEFWEKCHVAHEERHFGSRFDAVRNRQSDLAALAEEAARWEKAYAEGKSVYAALDQWKAVWNQKLEMEEKKKDPNYYQSRERGHSLMKDAQFERQLNEALLPKKKKDVAVAYAEYLKQHNDNPILIQGHDPLKFIEWTEAELKLTRERERMEKKKQAESLHHSPSKTLKSGLRTPGASVRIPNKQPRLDGPDVSIITPIRMAENGPSTSSPKDLPSRPITPSRTMMTPFKRLN